MGRVLEGQDKFKRTSRRKCPGKMRSKSEDKLLIVHRRKRENERSVLMYRKKI